MLTHNRHELLAQFVGLLKSVSLTVNSYNRLSVALAKVHPLVGEIEFHTVDVRDMYILLFSVLLLNIIEDSVDIR